MDARRFAVILLLAASTAFTAPLPPVSLKTETRVLGTARAKELDACKRLHDHITFGSDAWRIAWMERDKSGARMIVDGKRSRRYTSVSFEGFTSDNKQFIFSGYNITKNGCVVDIKGAFLIIDGKEFRMPVDNFGNTAVSFSQDCTRFAYLRSQRNKALCVFNNKPGPVYDRISELTLSPDGTKVAYYARRGEQWFVVIDNTKEIPLLSNYIYPSIEFSRNSRHYAFKENSADRMERYVVDGKPQPFYTRVRNFTFNPDGTRFCYIIGSGSDASRRERMVIDGIPGPEYEGEINMTGSPFDSPNDYTIMHKDGKQLLVRNGKKGPLFDAIYSITSSPDRRHNLYQATRGKQETVVIDDQVGNWYDRVIMPTFSPDSRHTYYIAKKDKSYILVKDGKEGKRYDTIYNLYYAPHSAHLTYVVSREKQWHFVYDEHEGPAFDEMDPLACYSPDGAHYAYRARKGKNWMMVVDGRIQSSYDELQLPVFSQDSRLLAYLAKRGGRWYPVINGTVGQAYSGELSAGMIYRRIGGHSPYPFGFDTSDAFFYVLAQRNTKKNSITFVRVSVKALLKSVLHNKPPVTTSGKRPTASGTR